MWIFKRCRCYIRAVIDYFKHGCFAIVRNYMIIEEIPCIIIATDKSFRVSDNYQHTKDETVYKNATLTRSKCIYCGAEELSWKDNDNEIPIIK